MNSATATSFKEYLLDCKLSELRYIANFLKLKASGNKNELISRIFSLGEAAVNTITNSIDVNVPYLIIKPTNESYISKYNRDVQFNYKKFEIKNCLCGGLPHTNSMSNEQITIIDCPKCNNKYHNTCLAVDMNEIPSNFICPACRITGIDPFHPTIRLLELMPLFMEKSNKTHSSQITLYFSLVCPNIQELRRNKSEVFIYCICLDAYHRPKLHTWPLTLLAQINEHEEIIRKPEYDHVRRDLPMKITLYLTSEQTNSIKITATNTENNSTFVLGIALTATLSVDDLYNYIINNKKLEYNTAKNIVQSIVKKYFNINDDADTADDEDTDEINIIASSCKVKLIDLITFERIIVPVRGTMCEHIQCFDLKAFLEVTKNAKSFANRWKCVDCNRFLAIEELIIDTFQQDLIQHSDAKVTGIEFARDGSWKFVESEEPDLADLESILNESNQKITEVITVDDDYDIDYSNSSDETLAYEKVIEPNNQTINKYHNIGQTNSINNKQDGANLQINPVSNDQFYSTNNNDQNSLKVHANRRIESEDGEILEELLSSHSDQSIQHHLEDRLDQSISFDSIYIGEKYPRLDNKYSKLFIDNYSYNNKERLSNNNTSMNETRHNIQTKNIDEILDNKRKKNNFDNINSNASRAEKNIYIDTTAQDNQQPNNFSINTNNTQGSNVTPYNLCFLSKYDTKYNKMNNNNH